MFCTERKLIAHQSAQADLQTSADLQIVAPPRLYLLNDIKGGRQSCLNEDRVAKLTLLEWETNMWYVIQVRTGTEESIRLQCEAKISPNVLERCFIPCYEERRKVRGDWRTLQRILFPGYVFLITEQVEQLYMELKKVIGLTRLLGTRR